MIGSREEPKIVDTVGDALRAAQIFGEVVWAIVRQEKAKYRVYPGGRMERWPIEK